MSRLVSLLLDGTQLASGLSLFGGLGWPIGGMQDIGESLGFVLARWE